MGSHDAMPIAFVACTVLHRLPCTLPRAISSCSLLIWREEVAVHRSGDAAALSCSCE